MLLRVLGAMLLAGTGCTEPPRPPDVLLVVLDTVRADRLHTYGHDRPTSNQLDAIATAGVRFTDVTASGAWTWPSHAALFTGLPPWESGAHWAEDVEASGQVDPETGYWRVSPMRTDVATVAERFASAGYRTVSLASNSLLDPALGLTRGFQRAEWLKRDEVVVQAADAEMRSDDDRPLFLFVNLMAAHAPYTLAPEVPWSQVHQRLLQKDTAPPWAAPYLLDRSPPALALSERPEPGQLTGEEAYAKGDLALDELDLRLIEDLYDGELIRLDKALVAIVSAWNETGRGAGILVVTSDHGEYLGEHGQIGHGFTVFDEVTRVPLVIAAPGRLPADTHVATPVQLRDVAPTLLDLAGLAASPEGSLRPIVDGAVRPGPIQAAAWPMGVFARNVGGRFTRGHRMYREGKNVLFFDVDGDGEPIEQESDERSALSKAAAGAFPVHNSGSAVQVPDEALLQLKALGYTE